MKKCLVTGGAGFIGSHLSQALLNKGYYVRVLDNFFSGKRENLKELENNECFELLEGDLRDDSAIKRAVEGIDTVFHQAALGSVPRSVEDPLTTHEVNVSGTLKLLWASKNAGVRRFVNAASSSAYGETAELPKKESMLPSPLSPYAVSKLAQEHYCHAFFKSYGFETVALRYFNVYGPRQDPKSQYAAVVPKFFDAYLSGRSPDIYGDGEQTRDFTYVDDVVSANILASESNDAVGGTYNIAGGRQISINELSNKILKVLEVSGSPKYQSKRPGDIRDSLADISLSYKTIGWSPKVSLEDGLMKTSLWYRQYHREASKSIS